MPNYREIRIALGKCPTCGNQPLPEGYPMVKTCLVCRDASAEYQRQHRIACKAARICRDCKRPTDGRVRCQVCRKKESEGTKIDRFRVS